MSLRLQLALGLAATAVLAVTGGPALAAQPVEGPSPAGQFAPGRVLVAYESGVDRAAQTALERGLGARGLSSIDRLGVRVLSVPEGAEERVVAALERSGKVAYAERDGVAEVTRTPNDYWWPRQWSPVKIGAPAVWDTTTGSASTTVAVLDTGVTQVPDLAGKLAPGHDFVNGDSDPTDDHGHGTMSAGVVGALSDNADGVASLCWSCTVLPVKVMGADGRGTYATIADGITWAADRGARVISLSLSGTATSTTLRSAVQYARGKGAVVVSAAGNDGLDTPVYPAAYPEVLGVAATDSADGRASYSNYGSWVDVAAPGSNYTTTRSGGYTSYSGTSSATPVVAGVAGLLLAASPSSTPASIETALLSTAAPVGFPVASGRVDAVAALAALGTSAPAPTPSTEPSAAPTSEPTAAPAPTTEPAPTVTTFSGSFTKRTSRLQFAQALRQAEVTALLRSTKAGTVSLELRRSDGTTVATSSGSLELRLTASVPAGDHTWVATGTSGSITLEVTQG